MTILEVSASANRLCRNQPRFERGFFYYDACAHRGRALVAVIVVVTGQAEGSMMESWTVIKLPSTRENDFRPPRRP